MKPPKHMPLSRLRMIALHAGVEANPFCPALHPHIRQAPLRGAWNSERSSVEAVHGETPPPWERRTGSPALKTRRSTDTGRRKCVARYVHVYRHQSGATQHPVEDTSLCSDSRAMQTLLRGTALLPHAM